MKVICYRIIFAVTLIILSSCVQNQRSIVTSDHTQTKTFKRKQFQERSDGFTFGSSAEHVASLMGAPQSVGGYGAEQSWYYSGGSTVYFKNGRVIRWSDYGKVFPVYVADSSVSGADDSRLNSKLTQNKGSQVGLGKLIEGGQVGIARIANEGATTGVTSGGGASSYSNAIDTTRSSYSGSSGTTTLPNRSRTGYSTYKPTSRSSGTRYYDKSYRPYVGDHYVDGHIRNDGSYVTGHMRTDKDDSFWNNYSSDGNVNPYTNRTGTKKPAYSRSFGGSSYVSGYFKKDGTYVSGHFRNR